MHVRKGASSHWPLITSALVLLGITLLLTSLNHPTSLDDGLRHITMASVLREEGIASVSGWGAFLYRGYFSEVDSDPWFLSDLLLVPLTLLPPLIALHVFTLLAIAVLIGTFLLLLRSEKLPPFLSSFFVLLLIFGNGAFLLRLLIARPFTIMTAVSLLTLHAIVNERWWLVGLLLACAVLLSHLFVFPLSLALLGGLWLAQRRKRHDAIRLTGASVLGVALGLLLHPHALNYLHYLGTVFVRIPFLKAIGIGAELYSGWGNGDASIATALALSALIVLSFSAHRDGVRLQNLWRQRVGLTAAAALLFLACFSLWLRAIDLLWPFLLLLVAQLIGACPSILRTASGFLPSSPRRQRPLLCAVTIVICLLNAIAVGGRLLRTDTARALSQFEAIQRLPAGARVLNIDWDLFPPLVFLRPDLRYARGMDPTMDYIADPEGFTLLHAVEEEIADLPGPVIDGPGWLAQILVHYPADFLVVDRRRHPMFLQSLRATPELREWRRPGTIAVFSVRRPPESW